MFTVKDIRLKPNYSELELASSVAKTLRINKNKISDIRLTKKSVDARKKTNITLVLTVEVALDGETCDRTLRGLDGLELPCATASHLRPIVIGSGPAGLFAALTLAKVNLRPIIIERGSSCDTRKNDVEKFYKTTKLNTESNIQFGEGGAGTFSDGKLNTGIKSKLIPLIFEEFVRHGAPEEILYLAKPHIGTDKLLTMLKNIREYLLSRGTEYFFNTKLTGIVTKNNRVAGIIVDGIKSGIIDTDRVIVATGHSACDTFEMLTSAGIEMEKKPFAVGVRIEHKRTFIDSSMYGNANTEGLGAADYRLAVPTTDGRGLFTFCMCPGGYVSAAASDEFGVVTNGMSLYGRNGENSNSALLTGVRPEDTGDGVLSGIAFQRKYERAAYALAGGNYRAPVQIARDFLDNKLSKDFDEVVPSYPLGTAFSNLSDCLPKFVADNLREGLALMDKKVKGFTSNGLLTGVEMRSSSPIRILRDERHEASIAGVYPAGEGAGYAGGIISAAVDGVNTALNVLKA